MWFRRARHITLSLQIEDQWSFHIKAPADIAVEASTGWLAFVQRDTGDTNEPPPRPPVGFSRTPPVDLGETTADTYRADDDD